MGSNRYRRCVRVSLNTLIIKCGQASAGSRINARVHLSRRSWYESHMPIRVLANVIVLIGLFLLGRVICQVAYGGLAVPAATLPAGMGSQGLVALGLRLPVPLHVIAVGLILQRQWLAPRWARMAWWAVVLSGCWLGVALLIKQFFLPAA